jgi:type II secretory pathway pseudopilin PulG
MQKNIDRYSKERGWTMMEVIGTLIIVGVMLSITLGMFNSGSEKAKESAANQNLTMLRNNIKSVFNGNYSGLTTQLAIQAGCVPNGMTNDGTSIRNAFGGDVKITPVSNSSMQFSITYKGLNRDGAISMVSMNHGSWRSITLNSATISQSGSNPIATVISATTDSNNTIVFVSE